MNENAVTKSYENFDAFTIEVDSQDAACRVRDMLGDNWSIEAVPGEIDEFDLTTGDSLSSFEIDGTYDLLREAEGVTHVESAFGEESPIDDSEEELAQNSEECDWALRAINVPEAWDLMSEESRYGEGIRIAHPDSGYRDHDQLNPHTDMRLLLEGDRDFVDGDDETLENSRGGGHGLGTASVIMSGLNRGEGNFVIGAAPKAKLMPLRIAKWKRIGTPVLFRGGVRRLRNAIRHATSNDCHVISISLGSINMSRSLHRAVRSAVKSGVVVLAAAGNRVRFVTIPARYNEVIAVAGCDSERRPWSKSSRGHDVDVTAPAKGVWKAAYDKNDQQIVKPGSGTSFAVALTAGVTALWLAHWGRSRLLEHYGSGERMVSEYKRILEFACSRDHKLPVENGNWGAGIVDAEKLLKIDPFM